MRLKNACGLVNVVCFVGETTVCICGDTHRHHVMNRVDVAVAHVDPDGLQREAALLPRCVEDNGRPQAARAERQVPARGGVTGRRVGGQRTRGDGTGLEAAR